MSDTSIPSDAAGAGNSFNPQNVDLDTADPASIICYLNSGGNEYDGRLGARVSALFVILVVSSAVTFFPVAATRIRKFHIPLYVYLFARYFGSGVIVATAFIHLLNPAYEEIGPQSCVGMTGNWALYAWPPAFALVSAMFVFLMDFAAERYVQQKYGYAHGGNGEQFDHHGSVDAGMLHYTSSRRDTRQALHSGDQDARNCDTEAAFNTKGAETPETISFSEKEEQDNERSFQQQIAAFLILEFGVIFHSVIIGLTLGTAGEEFSVLYPVIVFHQSFEGLGIGARLSAIGFPKRLKWLPWILCAGYGLTTPIAIAIGLGVRTTYNASSNTANIVSGTLDAISAGILLYTGFVELLARDFLFNPNRTNDTKQLTFMILSVLLGAALMALLGKWA